jgi:hypothetical protein
MKFGSEYRISAIGMKFILSPSRGGLSLDLLRAAQRSDRDRERLQKAFC